MCGVLEVGSRLDLGYETVGTDNRSQLRPQDLQRDLALVLEVIGQVDRRHAPFAQLTLDGVTAFESGVQGGRRRRTWRTRCAVSAPGRKLSILTISGIVNGSGPA